MLMEDDSLKEPARKLATMIGASIREMATLVADLLKFADNRLGAKMHITRRPMNLSELCGEMLAEMGARHPSRVFEIDDVGNGRGHWDRTRLRQLLSNLLVNAVQHGGEGTPIRLFLRNAGDVVVFGVTNQGPAIPTEARMNIFDPLYQRPNNGASRQSGSLGPGLYIAREVVEAHGGTIDVSWNDTETSFTVKLPREEQSDS